MKTWPEFDNNGDLPGGIHQATLTEVMEYFGIGSVQRRLVGQRLERIYKLAFSTGQVIRFDSAEKPSVHPSRASGRTEERAKSLEIFRSC